MNKGESPWIVFIRNCGGGKAKDPIDRQKVFKEPNPQMTTMKTPEPTTKTTPTPKMTPTPTSTLLYPTTLATPEPPPKVTKPFERPQTPANCPMPSVPKLPEPPKLFPPKVPIEAIAKEERNPFASDINEFLEPPEFPWTAALKNTSKPPDFFNGTHQDYYVFKGDHCFRPIYPASHFKPIDHPNPPSNRDNCKPYGLCLDMKVTKTTPKPNENQRSIRDEMDKIKKPSPRKSYELPSTTPICSGVILNERLVLTSATCVIEAQSVFNKLSNLQVNIQ